MAKANFDAVSATKTTVSDRRMRDHFLFMVDLPSYFGVCDAPTKHFRKEQNVIRKNSQSPMLICPK